MHRAHRLLYKRFKVLVWTGVVASATNLAAQTPWQSAPASPAPLNLSANTTQSTSAASPSSTQKPVVNRYATQNPQARPQLAAPQYPTQPQFSTQNTTQQFNQPINTQPPFNQFPPYNQAQNVTQQRQPQYGQVPGPPAQYQAQFQQMTGQGQASLSAQPPAMVPFKPTTPGAALGGTTFSATTSTYQPFDLPPPGANASPALPLAIPAPAINQPAASSNVQNLVNALQSTPPSLQQPQVSPNNSAVVSQRFPGAGQLLPRTQPAQTTANDRGNNTPTLGNTSSSDNEILQGRIPTLDDLPVPDLTALSAGTKHLLVSSGSNQNGPNEQIISDIWNTQLVAIVGSERVLAGDLAAVIEPIIAQNKAMIRNKEQEKEIRLTLVRQLLPQYIEMKALQQQYLRDIVGNVSPKELQKKKEEIMSKASRAFYDKYVPIELYRRHKVDDLAELEGKLQESKLSLNIMKNHFLVQVLAMQCEDKYVATSFEIPPGDILAYYEKNVDKWRIPARAKWRELVARFDRYPSRDAAKVAINNMGNEVFLGGKQFEAVAKDSSSGFTASDGGIHDWTNKSSLKSEVMDAALFNLPMHRLSEVIESDAGYHIVEVLEREPARTQEMVEIQAEIRKKLSDDIRDEKLKDYRKKVMIRTPVWTMWPEDISGSKLLRDIQE